MSRRTDSAAHIRRLACLFAHPSQRALLEGLLALEAEIGASARRGLDHSVAHVRLAYWREECVRAATGDSGNPLLRTLAQAAPTGGDFRGLHGLVTNVEWDLAQATFATQGELDAWLVHWAQAIVGPLLAAAGLDPALAADATALREAELLTSLDRELHDGRLRLPLDALAAAGVDPHTLSAPPWPVALAALLRTRHERLRARLDAFSRGVPRPGRPALRGLLVWSQLARAASVRAQRALPGAPHPGALAGFADALRAWRVALAAGD